MSYRIIKILLAGIIVTTLSLIVMYKAAVMPATFDEVTTATTYTGIGRVPDAIFNAGNNPNNHILNSLSITLCQFFLGQHAWTLRLPSIISFFILCACLVMMARKYFNTSVILFCLPFVCLLFNPYLIDFFSLARGYGMANAFMACSIFSLLTFTSSERVDIKKYYCTIYLASLAAYANFSFLVFWIAVHMLLFGNLMIRNIDRKELKVILIGTFWRAIGFAALCAIPLLSIQNSIRSAPGVFKNFCVQTLMGEIDRYIYGKPIWGMTVDPLYRIIILILLIATLNFIFKLRKNILSAFSDPFSIVYVLLILVWAINVFQVYWSDTDYPTYRTAIIYYVLFIFVLIFLMRDFSDQNFWGTQIAICLISIFFTIHFLVAINLKSVYEWSYDAYTNDVMDYIKEYRKNHLSTKAIELNLTNSFRNSFEYYTYAHDVPWLAITPAKEEALLQNKVDTASQSLFYYSADTDISNLKNYAAVKSFVATGLPVPLPNAKPYQVLLIHK